MFILSMYFGWGSIREVQNKLRGHHGFICFQGIPTLLVISFGPFLTRQAGSALLTSAKIGY